MELITKVELFELDNLVYLKLFNNKRIYREVVSGALVIEKIYDDVDLKSIKRLASLSMAEHLQTIFAIYKRDDSFVSYEGFIEGLDLSMHLKHSGDYSLNQYLKIFYGLACGLKVLHDNNLIHRDVKPNNVVIDEDDTPILIDFGIIRREDNETKSHDTKLLGTEGYASPEQYGFSPTTTKSDVYSLGICMQEILVHTSIKPNADLTSLIEAMVEINPDKRIDIDTVLKRLKREKSGIERLFYYSPFINFDAGIGSSLYYWFLIMLFSYELSAYFYTKLDWDIYPKLFLIVSYIGFLYLFKIYELGFKSTFFSLKIKDSVTRHLLFFLESATVTALMAAILGGL